MKGACEIGVCLESKMVLDGTVVNGQIVLEPSQPRLPEGAKVRVELLAEPTLVFLLKYAGKAQHLPADLAENQIIICTTGWNMNSVFADSFYFFALVNRDEAPHAKAVAFANTFVGTLIMTRWVFLEVADGLSRPGNRELFLKMHQELQAHPQVLIVGFSDEM
jgi:hypothetical protein